MVSALLRPVLPDGPWRHDFVEVRGCRFHLATTAGEPDWLAVPEAGRTWWSFAPTLAAAAERGATIAVLDPRGVGATDKPPAGYGLEDAAADLIAVARTRPRPPRLLGHGWGGLVAARAVHLDPSLFAGLVVIGTDGGTLPRLRAAGLRRRLDPDRLQRAIDRLGPGADTSICRESVRHWPGPQRITAALRATPRRLPELAAATVRIDESGWLPETDRLLDLLPVRD